MNDVRPGEIYRHFKGKLYQIVTVATHTENDQKLVIYQALYGDFKVYARPYDMFVSAVDREKYPDVAQKMRFEKVTDNLLKETNDVTDNEQKNEDVSVYKKPDENEAYENEEHHNDEEGKINPALLEFLNADTYKEKLEVLSYMKDHIDGRTLDNMAVAMDCVLPEGSDEDKYNSLVKCIRTHEKYELRRR